MRKLEFIRQTAGAGDAAVLSSASSSPAWSSRSFEMAPSLCRMILPSPARETIVDGMPPFGAGSRSATRPTASVSSLSRSQARKTASLPLMLAEVAVMGLPRDLLSAMAAGWLLTLTATRPALSRSGAAKGFLAFSRMVSGPGQKESSLSGTPERSQYCPTIALSAAANGSGFVALRLLA